MVVAVNVRDFKRFLTSKVVVVFCVMSCHVIKNKRKLNVFYLQIILSCFKGCPQAELLATN